MRRTAHAVVSCGTRPAPRPCDHEAPYPHGARAAGELYRKEGVDDRRQVDDLTVPAAEARAGVAR